MPQYNNFAYRLIGLEDDWIYLGENRHTTYTNLSPGSYTFEVRSNNRSNECSKKPTRLTIVITPPWYYSTVAFLSYIFIFALLSYLFARIYQQRVTLRKEVEISEYQVQQEQELSERKLVFFTNVSHDLRTPLTLIDAPVSDLLSQDDLPEDQRKKLMII